MRRGLVVAMLVLGAGCSGDGSMFVPPPPAPAGNLTVRWTIEDPAGETLLCDDLGVVRATIAIGGEPESVECGATQEITFEGISPGRLPVVVRLLTSVDIEVASLITNVDIVDQETTNLDHTFVIDEVMFDTGNIELRWRIDQRLAGTACGLVGAETVRLNTRGGSIATVDESVPCTDGMLFLRNARKGAYSFFVRLLDSAGDELITPVTISDVGVIANETTELSVNFVTDVRPVVTTTVSWTVTGTVATSTSCGSARIHQIEATLFARNIDGDPVNLVDTATAACADGSIALGGRPDDDLRVRARAFDSFGTPLATEIVDPVDLSSGSATVSVDFDP